ncbi:MAG: glycoside hydrolase family 13 protein [Oscillospiraceae bacterium]|jgi:glycosidase|nr:glycoside hydrolase family 13 protein [Oscillospiraceae bacterium]
MHFVPFRSRLTQHKLPCGAAPAGQEILLRVILPRAMRCQGVRLQIGDRDGSWESWHDFAWEGMEGADEEWWRCLWTPGSPALLRYRFWASCGGRDEVIGCEGAGIGALGCPDYWRLTVYDGQYALPRWVRGGVLYQIFPDRFCRSPQPKQAVPAERILRDDWGGEPAWAPDSQGKIRQYDFFGGDLRGIEERLPYLASLGVTCLYMNPIFLAQSNHRYDTADYLAIDPLLGNEADFRSLCRAAKARGIRILLDGVFSHTGADSRYFNRNRRFPGPGAYESQESPYFSWFRFSDWPEHYDCWWGIDILPELEETDPGVLDFFTGESGVIPRWTAAGAAGWRWDVADELPDVFLDRAYAAARAADPESFVLGEVWEDASDKWSHGGRRRFLLGGQMDSVMNYPLAEAILAFCMSETQAAEALAALIEDQLEHYPPGTIDGLMNHIGTHDTIRALTRLTGKAPAGGGRRAWSGFQPGTAALARGLRRLKLAAALQFTLPGNPCIYYGDEVGLEGGADPFNRRCFPWERVGDGNRLLDWYRALGALRTRWGGGALGAVRADGGYELLSAALGCVAFLRGGKLVTVANANPHPIRYDLPPHLAGAALVLGGEGKDGAGVLLGAESAAILELTEESLSVR